MNAGRHRVRADARNLGLLDAQHRSASGVDGESVIRTAFVAG
jgi:hypothetical protein